MILYDFDENDPKALLKQARKLESLCLREVLSDEECSTIEKTYNIKRKGQLGEIVEKYVFNKELDQNANADFEKAGVELKTTPLKKHKTKILVSKERLVLGMINFNDIVNEDWESSSFLKKNSTLLLMMYIFNENKGILDYKFRFIKLIDLLSDLPPQDIKRMQQDWELIVNKIITGKAHEISEADTFYLAACTKGSSAKSMTSQPYSNKPAKTRAFSLKQGYMTNLVTNWLQSEYKRGKKVIINRTESLFDVIDMNRLSTENSIDEYILLRFANYIGMDVDEIMNSLELTINNKRLDFCAILARRVLGIKTRKIKELEKADITLKTIRLRKSGRPDQHLSFPAMNYLEIVQESWNESTFREQISNNKFLFVVFQYASKKMLILKKVFFWNMPYSDLEGPVKEAWHETVERIRSGRAHDLPKISDNPVCHVRPHGANKNDTIPTPYGKEVTKKSFWFNAEYLKEQIEKYPSSK